MNALKAKLDQFRRTGFGQFLEKIQNDQATDMAGLLAWGTLSAILPMFLGILALAGLVLRDPQRLDEIYNALTALIPADANDVLGPALEGVRQESASAGIIALALLLFNGGRFFKNLTSIFNQAYHVENRNLVVTTLLSIAMLLIFTVLLVVSTLALGLGAAIGSLPIGLPIGPSLGRVVSWSISILTAIIAFLLLYRILPNAKQGWRDALPGALLAAVLFFAISMIFPLYLSIFPPNQAYAVFGVFLAFTFWLYLLGLSFVLGAELNAFLEQPARSAALAEAQAQAQKGRADVNAVDNQLTAKATGDAPRMGGDASSVAQRSQHARSPRTPGGKASAQPTYTRSLAPAGAADSNGPAAPGVAPQSGAVKKVLWAGLVSGLLAVGGLLARRTSSTVWQTVMREPPPTSKV